MFYLRDAPKDKKGNKQYKVIFVNVDVDMNKDVTDACKIKHLPTFNFYHEGKRVHNIEGGTKEDIQDNVDSLVLKI